MITKITICSVTNVRMSNGTKIKVVPSVEMCAYQASRTNTQTLRIILISYLYYHPTLTSTTPCLGNIIFTTSASSTVTASAFNPLAFSISLC